MVEVSDREQWGVTCVLLLDLLRRGALHVVLVGASVIEPREVRVGELLLAVLPPLVPVVVRRVRVRGPGALIFPDPLLGSGGGGGPAGAQVAGVRRNRVQSHGDVDGGRRRREGGRFLRELGSAAWMLRCCCWCWRRRF